MKRLILLLALCTAVITSCGSKKSSSVTTRPPSFPAVSVPMMVTSQSEAVKYMVNHFWDRYFDSVKVFSQDTSLIGGITKDDFDNAYREYITILWQSPIDLSLAAQKKAIIRVSTLKKEIPSTRVFDYFCEVSEQALYGVNSDYRNEELYLPILEYLSTSELVEPVMREKYKSDLELCSKNRIGTKAADFSYTTAEGTHGSLYKVKSDYILLFFSNPGCHACLEIINSLTNSLRVQKLTEEMTLRILNIYIDEDLKEWFDYMPIYPKEWINAYEPDLDIRTHNLYSVRAIPSLYLLDREKKVILKDVTPSIMMNYLDSVN